MAYRADNLSKGDLPRSAIDTTAAEWFARRDAGLSAADEVAFERWLVENPCHAAAFSRLEDAWSTFGKPTQAGSADQLLAELAARRMRRVRTRGLAAAAMVGIAAISFGVAQWRKADSTARLAPVAVLHSPDQRVLADGSTVTLREGADVAVNFTDTKRLVTLLKGEALFEVTKDEARPFVVRANGIDVRAVGTAFSVQFGKGMVDVLVTEGTVTIEAPAKTVGVGGGVSSRQVSEATSGTGASQPITVTAGNRVVVTASAAPRPVEKETVPNTEIERRLSWRAHRVEFSGMPLASAVALLNREAVGRTNSRLHIADRDLEPMRVSGIFRTDNMDAFVLLLEAGFGVRIERAGDVIVLNRATTTK